MANFSSFFPAAGGGGGFTKIKKYSTLRSADATNKAGFETILNISGDVLIGYTTLNGRPTTTDNRQYFTAEDSYVGMTFTETGQTHTVTASTAHSAGSYATLTFTPALSTGQIANNENIVFNAASITVNPATDLGLEDGASIGYFMCGGGTVGPTNNFAYTGYGGRIIQGTEIITTASTNLVLTPGGGENHVCVSNVMTITAMTESTITGGLTLSTADGSRQAGFRTSTGDGNGTVGSGVNGYGTGGGGRGYNDGKEAHGWGGGTRQSSNTQGYPPASFNFQAGDGAILLFY
jgi:hypothetical protein